jgi:hypothetical protein
MTKSQELFSEIEEEYDEVMDDWDIPDPEDPQEELDDWAETWLDGIELEDVEGYDSDNDYWEV